MRKDIKDWVQVVMFVLFFTGIVFSNLSWIVGSLGILFLTALDNNTTESKEVD